MLKIPAAERVRQAKSDIPPKIRQSHWLNQMKNNGCIGCHQLGQLSTRTIPEEPRRVQVERGGLEAAHLVRPVGRAMVNRLASVGRAPFKYFGDWTDRIAKGELPHTKPKRPQGVERNIVVTTWEWGDPKEISARPDRDRTAAIRRQCLWAAVRLAGILHRHDADPRSRRPQGVDLQGAGAGPEHAGIARAGTCGSLKPMAPSPYWGDEKIWDTQRQQPQRDVSTRRAGCGSPRRCAAWPIRTCARRARTIPSAKVVAARSLGPPGCDARSEDDGVQVRRHLLRDASPAVRL